MHCTMIVVGEDWEGQLAPFYADLAVETDDEGYEYNPDGLYDWYVLGGRWTGYWPAKAGVVGGPGLMTPEAKTGWFDQVLYGDIDFSLMSNKRPAYWLKDGTVHDDHDYSEMDLEADMLLTLVDLHV